MKNIFSEMHRRNVFRTVLFYAAACWLLIQIAETVLPIFGVPDWVLRFLIISLAAGFIPVILLSWIYEITPQGIKKESEVEGNDSINKATGRKIGIATVVLLLAIAALTLFRPPLNSAPEIIVNELTQGVAVLPFDNVSGSEENAFFATGVQEDILTHLSSIGDLRVISRTSMKGYVDSTLKMPEIAKQLGVSHLVEGSVRRAGNKVRVTVQLIDGATDEHIWAENYDRTLEDIFAIQSEVAQKIVTVIKQKLSKEEEISLSQLPTESTKAYELYHRALAAINVGVRSPDTMQEPVRLMQLATEQDPNYLQAWLKLVEFCGYGVWWSANEYIACADTALEKVKNLAPASAESALAEGLYAYRISRDYQSAYSHLEKAKDGLPNSEPAWTHFSYVARRLNKLEVAKNALLKVTQLNPLNELEHAQYLFTLEFSGDWRGALAQAEGLIEKFPDWHIIRFNLAEYKLKYLGQTEPYRTAMANMPLKLRWNYGIPFISEAFENDQQRIAWIESNNMTRPAGGAKARVTTELAQLARIRGDEESSQRLFKRALQEWNQYPLGSIEEQESYILAITAHTRARGGDIAGARLAQDLFKSRMEKQPDEVLSNEIGYIIIDTHMALGEPDLAWQKAKRMLQGYGITAWDLEYNLIYKHNFGHLAEYEELVSGLEVGKPPPSLVSN